MAKKKKKVHDGLTVSLLVDEAVSKGLDLEPVVAAIQAEVETPAEAVARMAKASKK